MTNNPHLNVYPTDEQAERWLDRADEWEMGKSEFVKAAVEAGLKNFDATAGAPDAGERAAELQDQRDDLRRENDRLRAKLRACEDRRVRTDEGHLHHALDTAPGGLTFEQALAVVDRTTTARVELLLADSAAVRVERNAAGERVYRLADDAEDAALTTAEGGEPFDAEAVLFGPEGVLAGAHGDEETATPDDTVYDTGWLSGDDSDDTDATDAGGDPAVDDPDSGEGN